MHAVTFQLPHLCVFRVEVVAASNINIHSIFIVENATHARHGGINKPLLLVQGPSLLHVRSGAGVRQAFYLCDAEITHTCTQIYTGSVAA